MLDNQAQVRMEYQQDNICSLLVYQNFLKQKKKIFENQFLNIKNKDILQKRIDLKNKVFCIISFINLLHLNYPFS